MGRNQMGCEKNTVLCRAEPKKKWENEKCEQKEGEREVSEIVSNIFFCSSLFLFAIALRSIYVDTQRRRNIGGKDMRALPAFFSSGIY